MIEFLCMAFGVAFIYGLLWCIRENKEINNG